MDAPCAMSWEHWLNLAGTNGSDDTGCTRQTPVPADRRIPATPLDPLWWQVGISAAEQLDLRAQPHELVDRSHPAVAEHPEDTIEECLSSLAASHYPDLEVIVCDDGSTDRDDLHHTVVPVTSRNQPNTKALFDAAVTWATIWAPSSAVAAPASPATPAGCRSWACQPMPTPPT